MSIYDSSMAACLSMPFFFAFARFYNQDVSSLAHVLSVHETVQTELYSPCWSSGV